MNIVKSVSLMKKIHKRTAEIVNIHTFTKMLTTLDRNAAAHRQEIINLLSYFVSLAET